MATQFNVELSMREAPSEAQGRAAQALREPARAVGLRLTKRGQGQLGYGPRVQFPFVIMLYHYISREHMTAEFRPGPSGGTQVTITGSVARGKQPLAADPDHWAEPLGASPATAG